MNNPANTWKFIHADGTFELANPDHFSHLYFPLVNEARMMSSITPRLHGDIKIGHHHYLMPPVSVYDLHNSRASRNFFVKANNSFWSIAGNAVGQDHREDETKLEAGILWHRMTRKNAAVGLQAEVTNFVPQTAEQVELMQIKFTNISTRPISFTPIASIPLFGRSAESLRDHRHVTSLLNRTTINQYGVVLMPVMSFDERGHNINHIQYAVLGTGPDNQPPLYIYPDINSFIGEGGNLEHPLANFDAPLEDKDLPRHLNGMEALGGLRFPDLTLAPGESCDFHLIMAIGRSIVPNELTQKYATPENFDKFFEHNKKYWAEKLDKIKIYTGDIRQDHWTRWVSLQPALRRLMGNSFLPYHDYGKGGRGWRDLWQDALGLLLMESDEITEMMHAYFAGIRMDGSNATIIGSKPGEFKADRNGIPRMWMDHGVWPLKTLDVYLNLTGDYKFLLQDQTYFKDHLTHRTKHRDVNWTEDQSNLQKTISAEPYLGSVFEHLLVQHLTAFFNSGGHNNLLLEDGDWNDGLDMANHKGESVAFSAFYAGNLETLAQYTQKLIAIGIDEIQLAEELALLLDRCFEPVPYASPDEKQARLLQYFKLVAHQLSGETITVKLEDLHKDLSDKAEWVKAHIRQNEWGSYTKEEGWFNGYYDNNGNQVEGDFAEGVRMTLSGQVFPIMSGVATKDQIPKIIKAADKFLLDQSVGGYRLNTDFKEIRMDLGRAFGFAFGHKENGAMFSHMAVMFAYALYLRGCPEVGYSILDMIYKHCQNFPVSKMYPGIPEYVGPDGRGYYFYLTGSASWYMFTLITQVFGVRGLDGDLVIDPQLVPEQFDATGMAAIHSRFAGRELYFEFHNEQKLPVQRYKIKHVMINDNPVDFKPSGNHVVLQREVISALAPTQKHTIRIDLGE